MEIVLELLPPRLLAFLITVAFIVAGIYFWMSGNSERELYDRAVGKEAKTYQAEVRRKVIRAEKSSGINDHDSGTVNVNYLELGYDEHGKYYSIDARVDRDEYDSVNEGDTIKISFHPDDTSYVVTPMKTRPGVLWHRLGGGILVVLGSVFLLMILISLTDG